MPDVEPIDGPSAGWLDVWRRGLNLASIAVPILLGILLSTLGVAGPTLAGVMIVVFIVFFVAALAVGQRVTKVMRRELEAGYSTLYDVKDFELRDARTRALLRAADVAPEAPGRKSLLVGMFRVKPGTVLAKRIDEDKSDDAAR